VSVRVGGERPAAALLVEALRGLDDDGVAVLDVAVRRPTLDDVFLALTGRAAEDDEDDEDEHAGGSAAGRAGAAARAQAVSSR
jgi:ABC-2 type transport system ATP-binding protein